MDIVSDHDVDENHSEKKKKKKKKKSTGDVKKEQNITAVGDENRSIVEMEKKTEAKRSQVRTFGNGLVIEEVAMGKPDGKRASPGKKGRWKGRLIWLLKLGVRWDSCPLFIWGCPLGRLIGPLPFGMGVEEKMRRKLALWKRQFLSKGGRITLIKSTLASIPLYQMSLFRMPKSVARRLEKLQRNFLWGGANGGNKAHLIKWEVVCMDKKKEGWGKWIWRFAWAKEELWKKVLEAKYGQEEFGWRTRKANGVFGVGVWKEILKESTWCWENMVFKVGKGNKVRFWIDPWCGNNVLSEAFPDLFSMAAQRNVTVEDYWDQNLSQGGWSLRLLRDFNDWELGLVDNMLIELRNYRVTMEEDSVFWKGGADGLFKVKEAYRVLINADEAVFPHSNVWVDKVPTKITFFAWEAT
uniref:Uncharacterized protein n=1 Tax=Vitis vinifera TaxID=29760 RepID=A5AH46_VITVI|nr:hypothetical protein VITISV_028684 [Vitis vinifera]